MILTRLMATTTNNQGDESHTTALKRQVQTLATAMERLIKQNHDLKEQLHQKNAALNTQKEDQEEPMLKEGIKRGWKAATPQVDKIDRIPADHLPQI